MSIAFASAEANAHSATSSWPSLSARPASASCALGSRQPLAEGYGAASCSSTCSGDPCSGCSSASTYAFAMSLIDGPPRFSDTRRTIGCSAFLSLRS